MEFSDKIQEFPNIETDRLLLRQLSVEDATDLFTYYSNPELYRHLDWNGPQSISEAKEIIEVWNDGFQEGWIIRWAIVLKDTDKIVGTIFLSEFEQCFRAEIGYELSQKYWNRGLMTEATKEVLSLGFNTIGLNRIQATIEPQNIASIKLVEKFNFKNEGLLRGYNFNETNKEFTDLYMYSLLKND